MLGVRVEPRDDERSTVRFFGPRARADRANNPLASAPEKPMKTVETSPEIGFSGAKTGMGFEPSARTLEQTDEWALSSQRTFDLQDPFVSAVAAELIFGGVQIEANPDAGSDGEKWRYRTILYRGVTLDALIPFVDGPWGMKDIRLAELPDGRVGVFTRPQGGSAGRGQIGFVVVDSLGLITTDLLAEAPPITDMFVAAEWGGVNDAVALGGSQLGVLGHIAHYDNDGNRHYYPIAFVLDVADMSRTEPVLLFERSDLGPGESKRPDLVDVVFPGGMRLDGDTVEIYCGAGDAEAYRVVVPSPFG